MGEIARELKMSRATVTRLVASLKKSGWVNAEGSRCYPSLRVAVMGADALRHNPLRQRLRPWLIELAERTGCPCALCFYDAGRLTVTDLTDSIAGRVIAKFDAYVVPAACTAGGKIMLAFQPDEEVRRLISEPLERFTEFTKTDPEEVIDDIRMARERGYSIDDRELTVETSGLAVPVIDANEMVVAALGVNTRGGITDEFVQKASPIALTVALRASQALGHPSSGGVLD